MTRRNFLVTTASAAAAVISPLASRLSVEGYIFQQYAERRKQSLSAVIEDAFRMARAAGFHNIELSPAFFQLVDRARSIALLQEQHLQMPSIYVGGLMHQRDEASKTIETALEYAGLCRPFGCRAVVHNPDPKPGDTPKTDAELDVEAASLNRMGATLAKNGFELRVHHHTPQLEDKAREWRYILDHTDPQYVEICVDVDWAYEAGYDAIPFLQNVGARLREIHVRSARNKLWLEDVEDSDINYSAVAQYLRKANLQPLTVVELAYRPNTIISRSLEDDLRISRQYVERTF